MSPSSTFYEGENVPLVNEGDSISRAENEFSEMVHFLNPISRAENYIYTIPRADIWKIKIVKNL